MGFQLNIRGIDNLKSEFPDAVWDHHAENKDEIKRCTGIFSALPILQNLSQYPRKIVLRFENAQDLVQNTLFLMMNYHEEKAEVILLLK